MSSRTAVVFAACCHLLPAQVDPAASVPAGDDWSLAEVLQHLASADARAVAWAAHAARQQDLRGVLPEVRAALARLAAEAGMPSVLARLQLLDVLIQWDDAPPAAELLPHAEDWLRVPALILATRRPEANRSYFRRRMLALTGREDLEWRVCGNQLAALREPGFARRCLSYFEYTLDIRVVDDQPRPRGCADCCRGRAPEVDPTTGFPPTFGYWLDYENASSRTPTGMRCVPFARQLVGARSIPDVWWCDAQTGWRDWLQSFGGPRTAAACAADREVLELRWTGNRKLLSVVRDEVRRLDRLFEAMVTELVTLGELQRSKVPHPMVHLRIDIEDWRSDSTRPLPPAATLLEFARR